MTAHDVYLQARELGLNFAVVGDKLAVIPKGACPPDFAIVLREHKGQLIDWLNRPPCPGWGVVPPDGLPLVSVEPRPTPYERKQVVDYLLRQGAGRPCSLVAWLVRRESDYYDGPGRTWDCSAFAYAAARDAACFQLNRTKGEVLDLLAGFEYAVAPPPNRR